MAVYRIFPEKDTTIWSEPNISGIYGNAGLDEILELGVYKDINLDSRKQRALIQFRSNEINSALTNKVTGLWSGSLHLYLPTASELPQDYVIHGYAISSSWTNGTGKRDDLPLNTTGATWLNRKAQSTPWNSLGGDYISGSFTFVSKSLNSNHDLDLDVTSIVHQHYSESIDNNGILLKLAPEFENDTTSSVNLKYFGANTNSIFPPYLEFKWDDSSYNSTLTELSTDIATVSIKNHKEKYADSDSLRFRLSARPKYPTRSFTTSSIYLTEYKLPASSYWGIKDENSGEMIIDFDTTYTKISADNTSSYFNVYMDSLQPERFYRLLVKTTLNNSTIVIDNKNIFKVTRNG